MAADDITSEPNPSAPVDDAPPPQAPCFDAEPFRPDNVVPPLGLAVLLGGVLLTATALGFVLSFVDPWMYLVVIFPCIAGALLGAAGVLLVRVGKARSPAVALTAGVLGGVVMMGSMHYFDFLRTLDDPAWQGAPPANVFEYIDLEAQEGVVIAENGNAGGLNLGYVGSYIYFGLEAVLAAALAGAIARTRTNVPFCPNCNVWKQPRTLAHLPHVPASVAVEAVRTGALLGLLETGTPSGTGFGLLLKAFVCPQCGLDGTVVATVEQVTTDGRGRKQVKVLTRNVYPGHVLPLLEEHGPGRDLRRQWGK